MAQALAYLQHAEGPDEDHRVVDLVRLSRATLGDRVLEREVLQLFVRQAGLLVGQMSKSDAARNSAIVHTLKGSARSVGAMRVVAAAEALEATLQRSDGVASHSVELRNSVEEAIATIEGLLATK